MKRYSDLEIKQMKRKIKFRDHQTIIASTGASPSAVSQVLNRTYYNQSILDEANRIIEEREKK